MEGLKKFFRSSILTSSTLILLGILLVFKSEYTIMTIAYIIGGILIATGALAIIKFIQKINNNQKSELDIIYGLGTIILGVLTIKNHQVLASIIPFVLGVGIIVSSSSKLQYALELKTMDNPQWKITMVASIISVICGVVLLFNPFKGALIITQVVGIFIIIYGVLDIISTFTIKKNVEAIHNAIDRIIEVDNTEAEVIDEEDIKEEPSKGTSKRRKKK